ncbi:hypothetical protein BKA64DRAFT_642709 [Cadophora sp. MPI-SDFR-AT-0126]|nr:hypothetical protein BKA64DRAFT_642709 [Leotiomycetes sp. MPI-SDFR-AT-0126]
MDSSPGFSPYNGPSMTTHGQRKYLWGNVPAFDVLNLRQNEGVDTTRDLRLLLAASGDLRNVAMTVAELPLSYTGQHELILNDIDTDIYSARIPAQMFRSLQEKVAPLILQAKTWKFGSSSLRIVLKKSQWQTMLRYFQTPEGLGKKEAHKLRRATVLAPERIDYFHRGLLLPPALRVGLQHFRRWLRRHRTRPLLPKSPPPTQTADPHATLITLFLHAIHEINTDTKSSTTIKSDLAKVSKYLPRPTPIIDPSRSSAAMINWVEFRVMFWDFDGIFGEYMVKMGFEDMARETGGK